LIACPFCSVHQEDPRQKRERKAGNGDQGRKKVQNQGSERKRQRKQRSGGVIENHLACFCIMPGENQEILKKIDINQDFNITTKELNDFLNNKNTKEEDIKAVADELNKDNQYLLVMIESTLNTSHDDIVNKIKKNQELSKTDILIFKLRRYLIQNKKNTDLSSKGNRTEIYADVMKINAVYKSVAFEKKKA